MSDGMASDSCLPELGCDIEAHALGEQLRFTRNFSRLFGVLKVHIVEELQRGFKYSPRTQDVALWLIG